jgi:hypothetical protein
MASAQDWCLRCGAGAPGSLAAPAHSWRSVTSLAGVLVLLVAGAAAAAYAAWGKSSGSRRPASTALAPGLTRLGSAAATAPGTAVLPPAAGTPASPGTAAGALPGLRGLVKPPKIPLKAATPKAALLPTTVTKPTTTTTPTTTTPTTTGGSTANELPAAILLDTNAAATYNPYAYPAANFGDPSLAIDGDKTTAWTAQVDPAVAPKMAEGLVIDLRSRRSVAHFRLYTSTPGLTVQIYGANGKALPTSITAKAWVPLSHAIIAKKKSTTIKLRATQQTFRYFLAWFSRAPESAIGTAQVPGHITIDEAELIPLK